MPSVFGAVASSAGVQAFFSIAITLVINWIIFVYGASWVRSFGTSKYQVGVTEKYRPAKVANFTVLDPSGKKIKVDSIQRVGSELALNPSESMNLYDTASPDFKASLEANFLWTILEINSSLTSRFYGPIWFQSSELKASCKTK